MEDFKSSSSKMVGQLLRQEPEKEKHPMLVGVLVFPNSTALRYGCTFLHGTLLGGGSWLGFIKVLSPAGPDIFDINRVDPIKIPHIPGYAFSFNCVYMNNRRGFIFDPKKTGNFVLLFAENSDDSLPIRQAAEIIQGFQEAQLYGVTYSSFDKSIALTSCEPSDLRQHASSSYYDWLAVDEATRQIFYREVLERTVELLPHLTPIPANYNSEDDDSSQEVQRSDELELVDQEIDPECDKENNEYARPSF